VRKIGGLLHIMLPLSRINEEKAQSKPGMFADTGVTALIQQLLNHGASRKRLIAKVAGGGAPLDDNGTFRIGERNYVVLRKVLWKNDILVAGEHVGGTMARTMLLHIATGRTVVRMQRTELEL
jgi:chemotaxis protein CheD